MSERATDPVANIELLPSWEGPAEHAPGVLFEEGTGKSLPGADVSLVEFAPWVALAAVSGVIENSAYDAIKQKVRSVVMVWAGREGQARVDELKQQVFEEAKKHRANGKLTEDEITRRIDAFFAEIRG